jgi:two-component system OmpR family sensor kinase
VLLILGLVAWLIVGFGLRPLDRIGRTADAIAGGDLSRRVEPEDKRTEIGRLGIALNRMLEALESSFSERHAIERRLRRFLADASHELRTPLTSIRGYAELYRTGAANNPAAVERSMERIEQEAARMGTLVEDMLSLARLDELRESERKPVDLAAIARDALDDARAAAPDRTITLNASAPQMVLGDADQLHQVLTNLTANALAHTPAGSAIEISVFTDDDPGYLRLELRDHGAGLPSENGSELFERFSRGAKGRERSTGGAGLGLAIVDEIVRAHGGRVSAENAEGGGARFSVWLPAA